jgi:TetR/AcrR family transcriptional regulator
VFAEDTLFPRINLILSEQPQAPARCRNILYLLLSFIERNPGFARLFIGDALQGETERLRNRMHQLLSRLETQLRQVLREYNASLTELPTLQINPSANLLLALAEGKISQFVRSDFTELPTHDWEVQWRLIERVLFEQLVS